jgi:hypothetical protein
VVVETNNRTTNDGTRKVGSRKSEEKKKNVGSAFVVQRSTLTKASRIRVPLLHKRRKETTNVRTSEKVRNERKGGEKEEILVLGLRKKNRKRHA